MERPGVTIHNTVSLDGQLTGFPIDVALYYDLAAALPHDAVLSGSGTMLAAAHANNVDLTGEDDPPGDDERDGPLLVVVDGGGRLTRLAWLRAQPFWRDVVVLCCRATPAAHLERLRRLRVDYVVAGDERVDLAAALHELTLRYAVRKVRVDAGGTLNGVLLRAGLVDELSIVVAPHLSTEVTPLATDAGAPELTLTSVEQLRDSQVLLRYTVDR
jgi:2,5-diamino-6-(ribosylamino)-4(3H)-pyrimidinone 5'-phosphate reductase